MFDRRERVEILKVILKGERVEDNIDYDYFVSLCDGYTGFDLFELCKKVVYFFIREFLDDEKSGKSYYVSIFFYRFCYRFIGWDFFNLGEKSKIYMERFCFVLSIKYFFGGIYFFLL